MKKRKNIKILILFWVLALVIVIGFAYYSYVEYQKKIAAQLEQNQKQIVTLQQEEADLRTELEKARAFIHRHLPGELNELEFSLTAANEYDEAVTIASRLWQSLETNDYELFLSVFSSESNASFIDTLEPTMDLFTRISKIHELMAQYTKDGKLIEINGRVTDYLEIDLYFNYEDGQSIKVPIDLKRNESPVDQTLKIETTHQEILNQLTQQ